MMQCMFIINSTIRVLVGATMKVKSSLSALLVVCLMVASTFMSMTDNYVITSDSNGLLQSESELMPGTVESPASPESGEDELALDEVTLTASRTVLDSMPFGASFASDYVCPLADDSLCEHAQTVGEAHNGFLNHFVAIGVDLYPDSAYTEPTAVESMQGFEEILARLSRDIVHNPELGCWASKGDGGTEWVQPCPYELAQAGRSGSEDSGRSGNDTFTYQLLPYHEMPPMAEIPLDSIPPLVIPGYGGGGGGAGSGGSGYPNGCRVWGPGGPGTEHIWVEPCPNTFALEAQIYGVMRSDLLARAEDLYENNDLGSMSKWERDRTVVLHSIDYYREGGGAELTDTQRGLANEVLNLLDDYFKIATAATEEDGDITLANLDQAINAVFTDGALESASPEALEIVSFVHATHYASTDFWTDYSEGDDGRWNWERFWEVVGDTAAIAGGALLASGGGAVGAAIGGAVIGAASDSYKNSVGGGGGDPPVECPLDRSLDQNWWSCAVFVATTRPLEEGDDGYGTEWAPDAIIPEFSKDWRGDYVSVAVYATDASGSAAADQLGDQKITEITRILVLHPNGGESLAWNCTTGEWPPWKDKTGYDCVELDPPSAHENTRSIGLLITLYPDDTTDIPNIGKTCPCPLYESIVNITSGNGATVQTVTIREITGGGGAAGPAYYDVTYNVDQQALADWGDIWVDIDNTDQEAEASSTVTGYTTNSTDADLETQAAEAYDFFISDDSGNADPYGQYLTIETYHGQETSSAGVGNNIDGAYLTLTDGTRVYATSVVDYETGDNVDPMQGDGFVRRATGAFDGEYTFMGNNWSKIVLCFGEDEDGSCSDNLGSSEGPVDDDSDGVIDEWDLCPNTPIGLPTDSKGCVITIDTGNLTTGGDDTGGTSLPGFTMPLAFSAMFVVAMLIRRKRLV